MPKMMDPENIQTIEFRLGYIFRNKTLLIQALTRTAAANEQRHRGQSSEAQENLSTLGDAVFKLVLIDGLMQRGCASPGEITKEKEKLEKGENLGPMLRKMCIKPIVGKGERQVGIEYKSDALAEIFEAIYQDGGYEIIKRLVTVWFSSQVKNLQDNSTG